MKAELTIKEIPNTKDIWIRDFMPIKNTNNEWVLFKYFPKYLKNPKFRSLICDNQTICKELGIEYSYINLILDGGSVVYQDDLYFVSERILSDNPTLSKTQIIKDLEEIFKTERIILIPEESNDFTGHLDGVMTILDDKTILINNFQNHYRIKYTSYLKSINLILKYFHIILIAIKLINLRKVFILIT